MREHVYFLYMLASAPYGTLYTGVTNNLTKRVWGHKEGVVPGFTKKYKVKMLVWYEYHADIRVAIEREKRIKRWRRDWKISLIEAENPHWADLHFDLVHDGSRIALRASGMTGEVEK